MLIARASILQVREIALKASQLIRIAAVRVVVEVKTQHVIVQHSFLLNTCCVLQAVKSAQVHFSDVVCNSEL